MPFTELPPPPPHQKQHIEYKLPVQGYDRAGTPFYDPRDNPFDSNSKIKRGEKGKEGKAPATVVTSFSAGAAVLGSKFAMPTRSDGFLENCPQGFSNSCPRSLHAMPTSSPSRLAGSLSIPGLKLEVDKIALEIRAYREALLFAINDAVYVRGIEDTGPSRGVIVSKTQHDSGLISPEPFVDEVRAPDASDFDKRYAVYSRGVEDVQCAVSVICDGERFDFDSVFEAYSTVRIKVGNVLDGILKFLRVSFNPTLNPEQDRAGFLNLIASEIGKREGKLDEMRQLSPIIRKYIDGPGIGLSGVRAQVKEAVLGTVCLPGEIGKLNKAFENHSFKGKEYSKNEERLEALTERLAACRGLIDSGLGFSESIGRNLTERQKRAFGKLADNKLFKKVNWILRELRGERAMGGDDSTVACMGRKMNENYLKDLFMLARDIGIVSEDDWYESKDHYRTLRRALLEKKDQLLRRKFKRERKDSEVLKSREQKRRKNEEENDFDNSSVVYDGDGKRERVGEFSEEFRELPDSMFTESYWDEGEKDYGEWKYSDKRRVRDLPEFSGDWDELTKYLDRVEREPDSIDHDEKEFYDEKGEDVQGRPRYVAKKEMFEEAWSKRSDKYERPIDAALFYGDLGSRKLLDSRKKGEGQNYEFVKGKKVYFKKDGSSIEMHSRQVSNPPRVIREPVVESSEKARMYGYRFY